MKNDLKTMTRKELEKLLKDVKLALQNAKIRDLKDAKKAAQKAAAEFGFSLGDLKEEEKPVRKAPKTKAKKVSVKAAPKYADPADPAKTWTGKGRQPNWFRGAVENGADPETLLI
jgi:DNA-binding protein H-NS